MESALILKEKRIQYIIILLLVKMVHTLSKATQNLIINMNMAKQLKYFNNSKILSKYRRNRGMYLQGISSTLRCHVLKIITLRKKIEITSIHVSGHLYHEKICY